MCCYIRDFCCCFFYWGDIQTHDKPQCISYCFDNLFKTCNLSVDLEKSIRSGRRFMLQENKWLGFTFPNIKKVILFYFTTSVKNFAHHNLLLFQILQILHMCLFHYFKIFHVNVSMFLVSSCNTFTPKFRYRNEKIALKKISL